MSKLHKRSKKYGKYELFAAFMQAILRLCYNTNDFIEVNGTHGK